MIPIEEVAGYAIREGEDHVEIVLEGGGVARMHDGSPLIFGLGVSHEQLVEAAEAHEMYCVGLWETLTHLTGTPQMGTPRMGDTRNTQRQGRSGL